MTNWDRGQAAGELLNKAKEMDADPSHPNTLALIGIGNALLQVAECLGNLDDLNLMVGCLDQIAHSAPPPRRPWG
jgi:hypothetical protein